MPRLSLYRWAGLAGLAGLVLDVGWAATAEAEETEAAPAGPAEMAALIAPSVTAVEPTPGEPTPPPLVASPSAPWREPAPSAHKWYGSQIMLIDLASMALIFAFPPLGAMSFFVAPAVVHGVHGRLGLGLISAGLRIAVPVSFALIGGGLESAGGCHATDGYSCGAFGAIAGLGLGALTAMIIDWNLAYTRPPAAARTPAPSSLGVSTVAAGVLPVRNGAALVLGGVF